MAAASTPTVPRWEWRIFGDLGGADEALAALEPERVQESDELYLLSEGGGETVKVRDGLMDVKQLQEVSVEGLQQWLPVLKAEFPLAAGDLAATLAALRVETP